ncbi:MAG: S8 family serine peptidase [Gaiellaceae bacterium]
MSVVVAGGASGSGPNFTVVGPALTPDSTYSVSKSPSANVAQTDPSLIGRTDATPVQVMIKYDFDATASYAGGVPGLAATSPAVTGVPLDANTGAVAAYDNYAEGQTALISSAVQAEVPEAQLGSDYQTAYGGVAATIPANSVGELLNVPGVAAVQLDTLNQPQDDNTSFIGAQTVWASLGGSATAGSNTTIGVIDTGIWPENPMFSSAGVSAPAGGLKGCQFGDGSDTAHLGMPFACNNKVIGAYAKMATYMANITTDDSEFCNDATNVCSPRDAEGHGTHTSSTAAGDCVASAVLYGVERGPVCGIAPGAHVIMYRVCAAQGCFGSDSVSAVQQAIVDGVNVINFSISGGGSPYSDPVELAFLDATNAGISVTASAGNSGPGAGTSDHGGPWVTTVGASTGPRSFTSTLHLTADGGASLDVPGVTLTNGISSPTPVVLGSSLPGEDALCQSTLAAGTATGKVVVCSRGNNGRIDKGRRVLAGGAAGMILYNQSAGVTDLESDNHYLPAIQTQYNANSIATFVAGHTHVMATWAQGTAQPSQADVMASFSSRGPTGDWIKPDVTAPGVQVLAGTTPQPDQTTADNGPPGNLYMAIAGTSMSSPHAAGVSLLVKAVHPSWTPEEIKSALMTSAVQTVVKEDGATPATPFDDGAGSIRADRAVNPTLVFNETYADFVAAGTDPLHRVNLNLASIDATTMPGVLTTQRTAINVSGHQQNLDIETSMPAGVDIYVGDNKKPTNPKNLHVAAGDSVTFPITIDATAVPNGQYFGWIRLVPRSGANPVFMPIAFVKQQGTATMTNACTPATIPASNGTIAGSLSHCTVTASNLGSTTSNVSISVAPADKGKALKYKNVGPPGSVVDNGNGVQWVGPLTPAVPPTVNSIALATGSGPAGGYLPLSLFSGNLVIPGGDDAITNINVPTFYYGGEAYTRIGVCTDGYVVIGGGTAADVNFFPQTFPSAARPNNVVAPFWTDLNTSSTGGGQILANTLTDGSNFWIVVDFEGARNFSNATTHTGEIWFQYGGPSTERITISYAAANAAAGDPGSAMNWGAENRTGTSGINIPSAPANNTEYRVNMGPPTPGGSVVLNFDVFSKKAGTYQSVAAMTSDTTPGTTQVSQTITVSP